VSNMQSESKIRHKLSLLRLRYREKAIQAAVSRKPHNCVFNSPVKMGSHYLVHICGHSDDAIQNKVCDERSHNMAPRCPYFQERVDKEEARERFQDTWLNASLEEFASKFPDAMALLWVLGEQDSRDIPEVSEEDVQDSDPTPVQIVVMTSPPLYEDQWLTITDMGYHFSNS
jgi:hypothetical protein